MRNLLLVAAVALSTTGCGIIYKQPIYQGNLIREDAVAKLQVGQSKQQVTALLGTPSIPDPFHAQRWDYTFQPAREPPGPYRGEELHRVLRQ